MNKIQNCPDHTGTYSKLDPDSVVDRTVERRIHCLECDKYLGADIIKTPFIVPVKALPERRRSGR